MQKIIRHIKRWNKWRKNCLNSKFHKFLVLVGIIKSPTMPLILLDDEIKAFQDGIEKGIIKMPYILSDDELKIIKGGFKQWQQKQSTKEEAARVTTQPRE